MNVRPAGREACSCASPYNTILERLDAMEADILAAQAAANSAMGVANAQAGAAAISASAAAASATAAGNAAISAAADASDALTQATAAAGSANDAADSASDALTALQNIENTIASVLASDIGGKVDKLTTAGFWLYMHSGTTQGEVQPVVAPTAATIPIRDSDGRMQAADPASGATDKTLVTANWVSQTGDSAPNNLVHKTGNETIPGTKRMTGSDFYHTSAQSFANTYIESSSHYNALIMRKTNASPGVNDQTASMRIQYSTADLNNLQIRCSAPKATAGSSEGQLHGGLSITTNRNTGKIIINMIAVLPDGTQSTKLLGEYTVGSGWSA